MGDFGLEDLLANLYGDGSDEDDEICVISGALPSGLFTACCTYSYAAYDI